MFGKTHTQFENDYIQVFKKYVVHVLRCVASSVDHTTTSQQKIKKKKQKQKLIDANLVFPIN